MRQCCLYPFAHFICHNLIRWRPAGCSLSTHRGHDGCDCAEAVVPQQQPNVRMTQIRQHDIERGCTWLWFTITSPTQPPPRPWEQPAPPYSVLCCQIIREPRDTAASSRWRRLWTWGCVIHPLILPALPLLPCQPLGSQIDYRRRILITNQLSILAI
jgi:hypothetical protein